MSFSPRRHWPQDGYPWIIRVTCIQVTRSLTKDIETAKARLKRALEAEREEKRNAKKTVRRR
jgi:hypothetical protein